MHRSSILLAGLWVVAGIIMILCTVLHTNAPECIRRASKTKAIPDALRDGLCFWGRAILPAGLFFEFLNLAVPQLLLILDLIFITEIRNDEDGFSSDGGFRNIELEVFGFIFCV